MKNVEDYHNLIIILKEALKFYANPSNYNADTNKAPIAADEYGFQARFALSKIEEVETEYKKMEDDFMLEIKKSLPDDNSDLKESIEFLMKTNNGDN